MSVAILFESIERFDKEPIKRFNFIRQNSSFLNISHVCYLFRFRVDLFLNQVERILKENLSVSVMCKMFPLTT